MQRLRCEVRETLDADYPANSWLRKSIIGFGLKLTAEENRNNTGGLLATWPIHLGTISLDLKGGAEQKRLGESKIDFAEALDKATCNDLPESRSTHFYPITGRVGLREVIKRFELVKGIGGAFTKDVGFVHTLQFTLKFNGGVKPGFAINEPSGRKLSGNLDMSRDRSDKHELIVKLAPPPVPELRREEVIKVEIVKIPPPPGAPPGFKPQEIEKDRTRETREKLETPAEAAARAERQMLRSIQEERRLRIDEEIRDRLRSSE